MSQQPFNSGCYYHVFNRGNNKEKIFLRNGNYIYFLKLHRSKVENINFSEESEFLYVTSSELRNEME